MSKKPIKIFKSSPGAIYPMRDSSDRKLVPVYKDTTNIDRKSITQEILEYPPEQARQTTFTLAASYLSLLNSIYDAVFITDMEGQVVQTNLRVQQAFLYKPEDMKQMNIIQFIAGADKKLLEAVKKNVSDENYSILEAMCLRSDQSRFYSEIIINQINIKSTVFLCFFIRDITERKDAEQQLKEAHEKLLENENLKARLTTIATLYYELNNPIQIMMCMAEINNNQEYKKQLNRIVSVLEQLKSEDHLPTVTDTDGSVRFALSGVSSDLEPSNPKRILIVDDEEMLRKMFASAIIDTITYLEADMAASGTDALRLFSEHHHSIIVLDVSMPGMSGEEVFREIKVFCEAKKWKLPKFIFCTGYAMNETIKEIVGDGANHVCLKKPLIISDMVAAVQGRLSLSSI